jgi:hypothetical protein
MLAANQQPNFGFPINIMVSDSLGKAAHLLIDREGKLSRLKEASSVAARLSDS